MESIQETMNEWLNNDDFMNILYMILKVLIVGLVISTILKVSLSALYDKYNQELIDQGMDMDEFCTKSYPPNKSKIAIAHWFRLGTRKANTETPIPLECFPSTHIEGLYVAAAAGKSGKDKKDLVKLESLLPRRTSSGSIDKRHKPTVVVATIRMGFGHHRLAYSTCSWSLAQNYTTIFHDLISIESEEANLINSVDALYSKFSRLATELGGPVEHVWGLMMKQGDADALRMAALFANHLQPLLKAYPKDIPLVCTHQICSLVASAAGFTNVINLVVDNYPQWFLVVPKTLNCVQGPVNYQSFLRMGVPSSNMNLTGHWCPHDMVINIPIDCQRRIDNINTEQDPQPIRIVIPVGGAGAQKTFITGLIEIWKPLLEESKIQIFLNAGDHDHMKSAFRQCLKNNDIDHVEVNDMDGVNEFSKTLLENPKTTPLQPVTLFAFEEYFPAVATTDILCRCSDVLVCKPSEMAFYPIPKLHIRRVGDHEADSARRACELGDGTMEARTVQDAYHVMTLICQTKENDLLKSMNEAILKHHHAMHNTYGGCQRAVELAVSGGSIVE
eukprot:scaffold1431_cov76-Cylindrotheca_fusiformis.AAC.3